MEDSNRKNVEIIVLLKYFSNFWKILEIPLILTWCANFDLVSTAIAN